MQKELVVNLPESFTSHGHSHKPHLTCVSLVSIFVHSISQSGWGVVSKQKIYISSGGVAFYLLKGSFSMDVLEAAPVFVHFSEFGGSAFRATDLLALVRNQLVLYCLSIVERLSQFQRVHKLNINIRCKHIFWFNG